MKPFDWMRHALDDDGLTPTQCLLVYALATHTMGVPGPCCVATWAQLQEWTHLGRMTVYENLGHLEERGWVGGLRQRGQRGRQAPNRYILTIPEPVDDVLPEAVQSTAPVPGQSTAPVPGEHGPEYGSRTPNRSRTLSTRSASGPVDDVRGAADVIAYLANAKRIP